jgi:hypothetical protein
MTFSDSELIEELESWGCFADALRAEDKTLFKEMLRLCYEYFPAMQARESPFPSEGLIMSILLIQHKSIVWLADQIESLKGKRDAGLDT